MLTDTRCAPFVRYPMARSTVLGGCLAVLAAMGALLLGAWALSDAVKTPLHLGLAIAVWALGAVCAWHFWARSPVGELVWSGQCWTVENLRGLQQPVSQPVSAVEVCLDLQAVVWVRMHRPGLRPLWAWLERRSAAERWPDLRRAVYSRPKPGAAGAPHSA